MPLVPAHHRAGHRRRRAQHRQDPLRVGGGQAAGAGEDGVVDAPDAEDAQLDHDAGQQHAHRGGGDRVCVRQPELEGHRRRLDQQPGQDEDEPGQHQRVGRPVGVERVADACQGEFAGTGVEQGDAHQQRVGAQRVDRGEGERALHGPGLLDAVSGQGVGDDAHQLEPDEGVEQVAGDREAAHARLEDQHERREGPGVAVRRLVEGAPGVGEGGEGEHADERGHAEAGASPVRRMPTLCPATGSQPPAHSVSGGEECASRRRASAALPAETAQAAPSATVRGRCRPVAASRAAPSSGTATRRGSRWCISRAARSARRGPRCRAAWRPARPGRAGGR